MVDKTPPSRGGISADVIWGKNMKKGREKEGKVQKKKEERGKKKEERVKKIRKGVVKGKIEAK
jgi:hypothetical protein